MPIITVRVNRLWCVQRSAISTPPDYETLSAELLTSQCTLADSAAGRSAVLVPQNTHLMPLFVNGLSRSHCMIIRRCIHYRDTRHGRGGAPARRDGYFGEGPRRSGAGDARGELRADGAARGSLVRQLRPARPFPGGRRRGHSVRRDGEKPMRRTVVIHPSR